MKRAADQNLSSFGEEGSLLNSQQKPIRTGDHPTCRGLTFVNLVGATIPEGEANET